MSLRNSQDGAPAVLPPQRMVALGSHADLPLVVDLDGTLTTTDTLVESMAILIGRSTSNLVRMVIWGMGGRAALKREVAARTELDVERLPYHRDLLHYLREQAASGRSVYLATATHQRIAEAVAAHLGLFTGVIATHGDTNLKGAAKLAAIREAVGPDFVYAADSPADLPIWKGASGAIVVNASSSTTRTVRKLTTVEREFPAPSRALAAWLDLLRARQWTKNLLVFVPVLTAFLFTSPAHLLTGVSAFIAFALAASAGYVLNDLLDVEFDRRHPIKNTRPLARGQFAPGEALALATLCGTGSLALAGAVSLPLLGVVTLYLVASALYSLVLKAVALIDVLTLSMLYNLRIVAGAAAAGVVVSPWLLVFSFFVFLSLALVKRCADIIALAADGAERVPGRGYVTQDLPILQALGIASGVAGLVVFGLFIVSPEVEARYLSPQVLWGVALAMAYGLGRMWLHTARGAMSTDPVVFAWRDRPSLATGLLMVTLTVIASAVDVPRCPGF